MKSAVVSLQLHDEWIPLNGFDRPPNNCAMALSMKVEILNQSPSLG